MPPSLSEYLDRWNLIPDGLPFETASSKLLAVTHNGQPAFLKVTREKEEQRGAQLMKHWNGANAALVFEYDRHALLLERACGGRSLARMAATGRDDQASRVLCAVATALHSSPVPTSFDLMPLQKWFSELEPAALRYGGILSTSLETSRSLLAIPQKPVLLHGDIHHGNVLDGGPRGWLAVDPKALLGERGFDYANIFCNPDLEIATSEGRLARQASVVAGAANLDRGRLLEWILAYAGLSAAWSLNSGEPTPVIALHVAESAAAELAR